MERETKEAWVVDRPKHKVSYEVLFRNSWGGWCPIRFLKEPFVEREYDYSEDELYDNKLEALKYLRLILQIEYNYHRNKLSEYEVKIEELDQEIFSSE